MCDEGCVTYARRPASARSKVTIRAERFGVAVLPAFVQESDWTDGALPACVFAHHPSWARAGSGSAKPRRSSISVSLSTTVSACLSVRYFCRGRYFAAPGGGGGSTGAGVSIRSSGVLIGACVMIRFIHVAGRSCTHITLRVGPNGNCSQLHTLQVCSWGQRTPALIARVRAWISIVTIAVSGRRRSLACRRRAHSADRPPSARRVNR